MKNQPNTHKTIYSNKFENLCLWDDNLPAGVVGLDVDETDGKIDNLYEKLLAKISKNYGDDAAAQAEAKNEAMETLLADIAGFDKCLVWQRS